MRSTTITLLFLPLVACAAVDPEDTDDGLELGEDELVEPNRSIAARPGEWVTENGMTVLVPPPGSGVFAEEVLTDGTTHVLYLETDLEGTARVFDPALAPEAPASATAAGSEDQCNDGAYTLAGWRWRRTFHWEFRSGTTPSEMRVDSAENGIRRAAHNITNARNICNLADDVGATHAYDGRTSRHTQVDSAGRCGGGDGHSVVEFGDLPDGKLAYTCTWHSGRRALESDTRLSEHVRWSSHGGDPCDGDWSVEAVMTHERGHTFGLAHVSEDHHGDLTMSPNLNGSCQNAESTLGLGDVRGLRRKY